MDDLKNLLGSSDTQTEIFTGNPFQPPKSSQPPAPKIEISRENRVIFIGNVSLQTKKKSLLSKFSQFGTVEKIWKRSVPVNKGKLPVKAAVALNLVISTQLKEGSEICNYYMLFDTPDNAQGALSLNGDLIDDKHIRVDLADNKNFNQEHSIFIGNLPYDIKEEDLWTEFSEFGKIEYVRVIRDSVTHKGKGIAYVCFKHKSSAKKSISKNNCAFKERTLRVKKVVEQKSKNPFVNPDALKKREIEFRNLDVPEGTVPTKRARKGSLKYKVRSEQAKLRDKREKRKEHNTKIAKSFKKPKLNK